MATTTLNMLVIVPNGRWPTKPYPMEVPVNKLGEPDFEVLRPKIMQALAPASDYEHVLVFWWNRYTDMFVDETGVLKGLPVNERATEIYLNNLRVHAPGSDALILPPSIHGPAVLFDKKVWF
jgi:hypothetical protein